MSSKQIFVVSGLDCADEIALLEGAVGPVAGGREHLAFDVLRGRMTVTAPNGEVDPAEVMAAVARVGMHAEALGGRTSRRPPGRSLRTALTAASAALTVAALSIHALLGGGLGATLGADLAVPPPLPARIAYLAAILVGGWLVLPRAWQALRRMSPDMHLLMTVAVAGAMALGDWLEAATVTFLFSLSLALESWSVARARRAVEALLDLSPPTARRCDTADGDEIVPAATVEIGSRIAIHPGERFPLDGRVVAGRTEVDQSPITGESQLIDKEPGSEVFAGTINGSGAVEIETTHDAGDTHLARIIRLVEEAGLRRSPTERWVERFARIYTPLVMTGAVLVFVGPPLLAGGDWSTWLYRALVLLVIACPCALVISTPVSVVAALARAARSGVLIKGGAALELPARLRALALDKTGTVTEGRPRVLEIVPLDGHDEVELLERAAGLEARSAHPLARAIVDYARERGVATPPVVDLVGLEGRGVRGSIGGRSYWLGSHRYLEERGQEEPEMRRRLEEMSGAGRTVVVVGNDRHVCGLIALADDLRPEAAAACAALRDGGLEHLVLLTGDNRGTAEAIAARLGLDEVRAELLPEEKLACIEELEDRYGAVGMVGDGVNDAPALARATLCIAMGAAGSDAAIETADVALMSDDLSRLPWLVAHSRRTLRVIRQNVAFALGVKAVVFALATLGIATLWLAIAADMGASLLVIANGLRLLGGRS